MTSPPARTELPAAQVASTRSESFSGRNLARLALLVYVLLVACPIRYWPLQNQVDPAWRFALNYAPVHGYAMGRDYIYTTGPLVYLIFPQHMGHNLEQGLIFQTCLWLALGAIFADVFFRGGFRVRNLALFALCFSLAGSLFWFNMLGAENLMLAGVLLLLVMYQLHGGWRRYGAALLLIGLLPLFKVSAGVIGSAALVGFLAARMIERRGNARTELAFAAVVPVSIFCGVFLLMVPSAVALMTFLRGSAEVMGGYSSAMSAVGPPIELFLAAEATIVLIAALYFQALSSRAMAKLYLLLLAGPFFISLKHGFVRQDEHVINFFCFIALALALVSLTIAVKGLTRCCVFGFLLVIFVSTWKDTVGRQYGSGAISRSSGITAVRELSGVLPWGRLQRRLDSSVADYPAYSRIEPELAALIGGSPVASLSNDFTNLGAAGLRLVLYPTLQRDLAYTPWMDRWDAAWIRDQGPKYLVFDGESIDQRDPWAETPAMWLEIYRWYDTRMLGPKNLLLQRRAAARFGTLESIGHARVSLSDELQIPRSTGPVFWTMKCRYSPAGLIRKMLTRIPVVTISAQDAAGAGREVHRLIPEVVVSPVLGNYLPNNLAQFAAVFEAGGDPGYSVDRLRFGGDGAASYASPCEVEFLRPAQRDQTPNVSPR